MEGSQTRDSQRLPATVTGPTGHAKLVATLRDDARVTEGDDREPLIPGTLRASADQAINSPH